MKPLGKYLIRSVLALLAYSVGLSIMLVLYKHNLPPPPYKALLILLPIVPLLYFVAALIRHVSSLDEMWRKILTEAMAFSGLATGFTCFSYLFLLRIGAPAFQPEWAWYLLWFYYGLGCLWSSRRFA